MPIKQEFYQAEDQRFWRNKTAAGARCVMADPSYVQIRFPELLENFAAAGWDFPNIRFAVDHIPLVQDGARHTYLRKLATKHIRSVSAHFPEATADILENMNTRMQKGGEIEIMSEIVFPMVSEVMTMLSGLDYIGNSSLALGQDMSLTKLRKLEQICVQLRAQSKERFPDESPESTGMRMSFATIGAEPLMGTLGCSLDKIFCTASGQKISELDWPEAIPATGVTHVLRTSKNDNGNDLGDCAKNVRFIDLDLTPYLDLPDEKDRLGIFGTGIHSCLGRGYSVLLWRKIVENMKKNDAKITYLGSAPSTRSIFEIPKEIRVKISHDT